MLWAEWIERLLSCLHEIKASNSIYTKQQNVNIAARELLVVFLKGYTFVLKIVKDGSRIRLNEYGQSYYILMYYKYY